MNITCSTYKIWDRTILAAIYWGRAFKCGPGFCPIQILLSEYLMANYVTLELFAFLEPIIVLESSNLVPS